MPAIFEYLGNIVYFLIFASVAGIFAPAGKFRKFVSLVLGFVLLLLMVQPLAGILRGGDIPVTEWFAGAMPTPGAGDDAGYAAMWDEHLRGSFEAQLEAQLSRLLAANGFDLHHAQFSYSADFMAITEIHAEITSSRRDENVPFIRIVPPEISPIRIGEQDETCRYSQEAKKIISEFYNLPLRHINVRHTKAR